MSAQFDLTTIYRQRRRRLMEQIGNGIILMDGSGRAPDRTLQDRNLEYLTGVQETNAYLLLAPNGVRVERLETRGGPELMRGHLVQEILFVDAKDARAAFMDGAGSTKESLQTLSGVDRVYDLAKLNEILPSALPTTDTLWLNTPSLPPFGQPATAYMQFIEQIRQRYYWLQLRNIAAKIHELRFVKDDYEVASLREAFEIHTAIFEQIMRTIKPGDNEALALAIFDYEVTIRGDHVTSMGAEDYTASLIVAAGKNAAIPHYMENNQIVKDGDLVLIDSGVSVNGYSSDITRTFPANGRFTPRQRELYAIVLEALYAAIDTMKPGSTMLQAHQAVYDVFKRYGVAEYSYGNCGHPVGLSIHDAHARYPDDREQPFAPGVVVVIEPFLMLPEEGLGIRIEDGVLITPTGHELLAGPAREIKDVEELCRRD